MDLGNYYGGGRRTRYGGRSGVPFHGPQHRLLVPGRSGEDTHKYNVAATRDTTSQRATRDTLRGWDQPYGHGSLSEYVQETKEEAFNNKRWSYKSSVSLDMQSCVVDDVHDRTPPLQTKPTAKIPTPVLYGQDPAPYARTNVPYSSFHSPQRRHVPVSAAEREYYYGLQGAQASPPEPASPAPEPADHSPPPDHLDKVGYAGDPYYDVDETSKAEPPDNSKHKGTPQEPDTLHLSRGQGPASKYPYQMLPEARFYDCQGRLRSSAHGAMRNNEHQTAWMR